MPLLYFVDHDCAVHLSSPALWSHMFLFLDLVLRLSSLRSLYF